MKAPMTQSIIKLVNNMGKEEGQVEGIEFWDFFERTTINDIELGNNSNGMLDNDDLYDNNSNASDETFVLDEKKIEEEYKRDRILDEAEENTEQLL